MKSVSVWSVSVLFAALFCAPCASAEDLLQAYELARSSDPQVKIVDVQRKNAVEGVNLARSALLPQVNASYSYDRADSQSERSQAIQNSTGQIIGVGRIANSGTSTTDGPSARLNQTIYDHANYTRLRAARAQAASADFAYRAAEQTLILRVATAYFAVLTAQDVLASSQAEERAVARQLEQAEQRFNVGLTAITDVHEARARHDGAVAASILSENALDDTRAALTELTGKNIETLAAVREKIINAPLQPSDWQAWVELALKNNPTLAARTATSDAAEASIATAKAARYPTVSSFVNYNDSTTTGGSIAGFAGTAFNSATNTTVGVQVNVPIFSGFGTTASIKQAINEAERNKDALEQERRAITRQTRNAFRSVLAGGSEVKAREQALVSAKSALEATEAGFEVGTRTIVDVLLSQQILYQAQRDYARARHDLLVNGLRLKASAGVIKPEDLQLVNAQLVGKAN
jgi:outer membrane protein